MTDVYYTHAMWRVREGRGADFVRAWNGLGAAFEGLDRKPLWGTLLQSLSDPHLFFSFGPWERLEDIEAMRGHAGAQAAIARVRALCDDATPGACRRVVHVEVARGTGGGA